MQKRTREKVKLHNVYFENGNVYSGLHGGELYGTEEEFYNDKDMGKIEVIDYAEMKTDEEIYRENERFDISDNNTP